MTSQRVRWTVCGTAHPAKQRIFFVISSLLSVCATFGDVPASNTTFSGTNGSYVVLPHMEGRIGSGLNYIYCPSFQMAWDNLVSNLLKGPLQLEGDPEIARVLNRTRYDPGNLDSNNMLVASGYMMDGIVAETRKRFVEKFGEEKAVLKALDELPPPRTPKDFIMFAYLDCSFGFREPFEVFEKPLRFHRSGDVVPVASFGVSTYSTNRNSEAQGTRWRQIIINDYRSDEDFILTLKAHAPPRRRPVSAGSKDESSDVSNRSADSLTQDRSSAENSLATAEIIVAMIPPGETLKSTWNSVLARIAEGEKRRGNSDMAPTAIVRIPKLQFDVTKDYDELLQKAVKNLGFEGLAVFVAKQWVKFRLDEKGAELKSLALFGAGGCAILYMPPPRRFVVDRPFLLVMRHPGKEPHLVLWIGNPDFLQACSKPFAGYVDHYGRGMEDAKKSLDDKKFVLKTSDGPVFKWEQIRRQVRLARYGVRTEVVLDLNGEALDDYIQGYNACMTDALKEKFGETVLRDIELYTETRCHHGSYYTILNWLPMQQNKDGSWGAAESNRTILTSLALLSSSALGEITDSKERGDKVRRGLDWLASHPAANQPAQSDESRSPGLLSLLARLEAFNVWKTNVVSPAIRSEVARLIADFDDRDCWQLLALRSAQESRIMGTEVDAVIAKLIEKSSPVLSKKAKPGDEQFFRSCLVHLLFSKEELPRPANDWLSEELRFPLAKFTSTKPLQEWYFHMIAAELMGGPTFSQWIEGCSKVLKTLEDEDGLMEHPGPDTCLEKKAFAGSDGQLYATLMSRLATSSYYRFLSFTLRPAP